MIINLYIVIDHKYIIFHPCNLCSAPENLLEQQKKHYRDIIFDVGADEERPMESDTEHEPSSEGRWKTYIDWLMYESQVVNK